MAILDKLMFWKKKDDLPELPDIASSPTPLPSEARFGRGYEMPEHPFFAATERPQFGAQNYPQQPVREKDLEIISAKLDAIKANVESISQRLERLERLAVQ